MIQTEFRARLRDRRGLAAVHYILMVLIALVLLMFVVEGYMRHLQDIAMTSTARRSMRQWPARRRST